MGGVAGWGTGVVSLGLRLASASSVSPSPRRAEPPRSQQGSRPESSDGVPRARWFLVVSVAEARGHSESDDKEDVETKPGPLRPMEVASSTSPIQFAESVRGPWGRTSSRSGTRPWRSKPSFKSKTVDSEIVKDEVGDHGNDVAYEAREDPALDGVKQHVYAAPEVSPAPQSLTR